MQKPRKRHVDACPVEFPLSLTDSEAAEATPGRVPGVEFPLSLTDSEVEFPVSFTDSTRAEATPGRVPCGVPP